MSRDWPAFLSQVKATPGVWVLAAEGVGTNRCRPIMNKGLRIRCERTSASPVRFDIFAMYGEPEIEAPYEIMTLVEMLSGSLVESGGETNEAIVRAIGWTEANPGRWFIVGHMSNLGSGVHSTFGMDLLTARRSGLEAEMVNNTVYARTPSADGLPIDTFVVRLRAKHIDPLPTLHRDKFDWSLPELRNAVSTAREWLQGGVASVAA